jgi:hypothetical protein
MSPSEVQQLVWRTRNEIRRTVEEMGPQRFAEVFAGMLREVCHNPAELGALWNYMAILPRRYHRLAWHIWCQHNWDTCKNCFTPGGAA